MTEEIPECVYCGALVRFDETGHADDCPSVTRIYPARNAIAAALEYGDELYRCDSCREVFQPADHYYEAERIPLPDDDAFIVVPVCLGCAATIMAEGEPHDA